MIVMSLAVVIPLQSSINDVIENQKENKTKKKQEMTTKWETKRSSNVSQR